MVFHFVFSFGLTYFVISSTSRKRARRLGGESGLGVAERERNEEAEEGQA